MISGEWILLLGIYALLVMIAWMLSSIATKFDMLADALLDDEEDDAPEL